MPVTHRVSFNDSLRLQCMTVTIVTARRHDIGNFSAQIWGSDVPKMIIRIKLYRDFKRNSFSQVSFLTHPIYICILYKIYFIIADHVPSRRVNRRRDGVRSG